MLLAMQQQWCLVERKAVSLAVLRALCSAQILGLGDDNSCANLLLILMYGVCVVHNRVSVVMKIGLTKRLQYRDTCSHNSKLGCNEKFGPSAGVFWKNNDKTEYHWLL
jgi:hypothetical protein